MELSNHVSEQVGIEMQEEADCQSSRDFVATTGR